ncbi:MAG: SurA N-terminal domain-containing protein [Gammaproteobacteria bacterium]
MLQTIHDRAKGWIAYAIIILITIPFALWGIERYFGNGGKRVAVEVNGTEISTQAFMNAYRQQEDRLRNLLGGTIPAGMLNTDTLKQSTLQGLIRQTLLDQVVADAGYRITNQQLFQRIKSFQVFQVNGQFSVQRYEQILASQRLSKSKFEGQIRQEMRVEQMQNGLIRTGFVPPSNAEDFLRLQHQTRDFDYVLIQPAAFKKSSVPDAKTIGDYYTAHKSDFMSPERVRLDYVELDPKALEQAVKPTEAELKKYYHAHASQFQTAEQRRASQILLNLPQNADAARVASVEKLAHEIETKLNGGADFAKLAEKYSNDSYSKKHGGDLGYIAKGDMSPAFEQVLFSLAKGQVSQPVRTRQGVVIIKLTGIKPGQVRSFDQAKQAVEQAYRKQHGMSRFNDLVEKLQNVSYENPNSLQAAADAVGGEVKYSGWITRKEGAGIGANPKVRKAAFSDDVFKQNYNSDLIDLQGGAVAVVRIKDKQAPRQLKLDEVRDQIRQQLETQTMQTKARDAGKQSLQTLLAGKKSLQRVAATYQARVQAVHDVVRTKQGIPQSVLNTAFSLPHPAKGQTVYGGVALPDGGYALLELRDVKVGSFKPDEMQGAERLNGVTYGNLEFDALYRALEGQAKIKVYKKNL